MKCLPYVSLALVLVFSGCSSLDVRELKKRFTDENQVFVGKTYDDLIKGKGVPTGSATLSDGSKVVEYYNAQIEISGGGSYPYPTTNYIPHPNGGGTWIYVDHMRSLPVRSWNKICKIDFVVSPKNTVESWKYEGKGCYSAPYQ